MVSVIKFMIFDKFKDFIKVIYLLTSISYKISYLLYIHVCENLLNIIIKQKNLLYI